jgi:hypothetical protein
MKHYEAPWSKHCNRILVLTKQSTSIALLIESTSQAQIPILRRRRGNEGGVLDVQPLFDPKLPPSADSDFKPKIGVVSTLGSDFEGLRRHYPQLHLTIVDVDVLPDVRRFGHCKRIIALRNEISAVKDALLNRRLRHQYIRLDGGMNG